MTVYELQAINTDGSVLGILPHFSNIEAGMEFSSVGLLRLIYPRLGVNFAHLAKKREIRLLVDGVEPTNARWRLEEREGNDVSEEAGGSAVTWAGRSMLAAFEFALVWPSDVNIFSNITAGNIIRTYALRAQARGGGLYQITFNSFSSTLDSNGVAWTKQLPSIEYRPGVNMLQIIENLVDQGMCEVAMVGRDLRVYNPGTLSTDRTVTNPPVILRAGRDIAEAPFRASSRGLATVALVVGDNGAFSVVSDATAILAEGRLETFISQGGVSDTGTLTAIGQAQLDIVKQERLERTYGLTLDPDGPLPQEDYFVGDYVFSDVGEGNVKYRVRQHTLTIGQDGSVSGSVVLNDKFAEFEESLVRRVNGILGGATSIGIQPAKSGDKISPSAPAAPTLSSAAYVTPSGTTLAQVTASWPQVTTNTDGTAIDDLSGYEVRYRVNAGNWAPAGRADAAVAFISGFTPGANVDVQVVAIDTTGNRSAWSASGSVVAASDAVAPPVPSTPTVDGTTFLGAIRITWDGLGSAGEAMPTDFDRVEIHASTVSGFTPTAATMRANITAIGGVVTLPLTVGVPWFVKLVSVDYTGNRSAASTQASATPRSAVNGDLGAGIVQNANIANLAVDDAKIASLSVGKITAGTLAADVVLGARVKTADTGARVEMNSAGLKVYNSGGILVVDLNSNGTASFTGTLIASDYLSKATHPRVEIGPSATYGGDDVIRFTRANGTTAAQIVRYESGIPTQETFAIQDCDTSGNPSGSTIFVISGGAYGWGLNTPQANGFIMAEVVDMDAAVKMSGLDARIVSRNSASVAEGSVGTLRDWERARVPVTFNGTASKDTTYTFVVGFGQRPVTVASSSDAGAALGNFYAQVVSSGATSCVVRLRDVDGTARTGSANADIIAML